MGKPPADACPYPRPFPDGFDECAAFKRTEARSALSADESSQTLGSCCHLTVGTFFDGANHRYGRCRLGDSVTRLAQLKNEIVQRHTYINMYADPDSLDQPAATIPPPA